MTAGSIQTQQGSATRQLVELLTRGGGWNLPDHERLLAGVIHPRFNTETDADLEAPVHRSVIAHAMNLMLLERLLDRVPDGAAYVEDKWQRGELVMLDHGALRTVCRERPTGGMPSGHLAFRRILEPLGYTLAGEYPLDKISMCGFVYASTDLPEHLSQFFVSELYPERFSEAFQSTVDSVLASEVDPLSASDLALLDTLQRDGSLDMKSAAELLPSIVNCFERHHRLPSLLQYQQIKDESREMAWISTEGNAFNHATDRVADIRAVEADQRAKGRAIKPEIEVARNVAVQQTAFRAASVLREIFASEAGATAGEQGLEVPGSFFEFIERGSMTNEGGAKVLDLRFDSANAQGIFKMTSQ